MIGNTKYMHTVQLGMQPLNDAQDITTTLQQLGFTVKTIQNADKKMLETHIRQFTKELEQYDVGLFYYAGHGLGIGNKNYIVPVDFPKNPTKADVEYVCVATDWVQAKMAEAGNSNKTNILIMDACRNDGNLRKLRGEYRGDSASGAWVSPLKVPTGFITCYAASSGQTSDNGSGRNGLYTGTLLKYIQAPNLKIEDLFKLVRVELLQLGGQEPEETTKLTKDFYFNRQ